MFNIPGNIFKFFKNVEPEFLADGVTFAFGAAFVNKNSLFIESAIIPTYNSLILVPYDELLGFIELVSNIYLSFDDIEYFIYFV